MQQHPGVCLHLLYVQYCFSPLPYLWHHLVQECLHVHTHIRVCGQHIRANTHSTGQHSTSRGWSVQCMCIGHKREPLCTTLPCTSLLSHVCTACAQEDLFTAAVPMCTARHAVELLQVGLWCCHGWLYIALLGGLFATVLALSD